MKAKYLEAQLENFLLGEYKDTKYNGGIVDDVTVKLGEDSNDFEGFNTIKIWFFVDKDGKIDPVEVILEH